MLWVQAKQSLEKRIATVAAHMFLLTSFRFENSLLLSIYFFSIGRYCCRRNPRTLRRHSRQLLQSTSPPLSVLSFPFCDLLVRGRNVLAYFATFTLIGLSTTVLTVIPIVGILFCWVQKRMDRPAELRCRQHIHYRMYIETIAKGHRSHSAPRSRVNGRCLAVPIVVSVIH